jgi:hypothetical protein
MIRSIRTVSAAVAFGALFALPVMAQTTTAPKAGAMKLTQAQCQTIWNRLDAAKSGSVTQAATQPYVTDFKSVDANSDGKLTQAEFQAGCDKGVVHDSAGSGAGSGTSGSTAPSVAPPAAPKN